MNGLIQRLARLVWCQSCAHDIKWHGMGNILMTFFPNLHGVVDVNLTHANLPPPGLSLPAACAWPRALSHIRVYTRIPSSLTASMSKDDCSGLGVWMGYFISFVHARPYARTPLGQRCPS